MRWIFAGVLAAVMVALVMTFVRNARAIRNDVNQRFDAFQARLERDAMRLADELLNRSTDVKDERGL